MMHEGENSKENDQHVETTRVKSNVDMRLVEPADRGFISLSKQRIYYVLWINYISSLVQISLLLECMDQPT